jgi:flagellar operon protein
MNRIAEQFTSIEPLQYQTGKTRGVTESDGQGSSFQKVLQQKQSAYGEQNVVFSKHANQRLQSRNMNLTQEQMERLNSGVEQAREKNIKESLILVDNMSFIVNVKNNTVVTALNGEDEQNVFTNIDGAVIS